MRSSRVCQLNLVSVIHFHVSITRLYEQRPAATGVVCRKPFKCTVSTWCVLSVSHFFITDLQDRPSVRSERETIHFFRLDVSQSRLCFIFAFCDRSDLFQGHMSKRVISAVELRNCLHKNGPAGQTDCPISKLDDSFLSH